MWIAFIFVSLNYQKHPTHLATERKRCCELLSFLYLWTIKSIYRWTKRHDIGVVNCFHFCIFELSKASIAIGERNFAMLWIAFIFVSLNYQKHLIKNRSINLKVVNCFHFCIFELSKASRLLLTILTRLLWIAFIFVSLNYQKHRLTIIISDVSSCELLSFLYLWTIKSIGHWKRNHVSLVVNCFHFCIFELSKASVNNTNRSFSLLWIAFIFVSLNYQKHQIDEAILFAPRCELLSFLYLWTIKSIFRYCSSNGAHVVNCFHFCIFELSKASLRYCSSNGAQLWIAFIFVSLNYQKHLNTCVRSKSVGCELLSFLYLWTIKSISGWRISFW